MELLRKSGGGINRKPLLKSDILNAQKNSLSAQGAARFLGVSYKTYTKYAKMYGVHTQHLNPMGKGIPKSRSAHAAVPLQEILDGKHPSYSVEKLKQRLIKEAVLDEECALCGFNERRITDYRVPLMLVFRDGNKANHHLDNMMFLCFNCAFLTVGELNNINTTKIGKLSEVEHTAMGVGETGTFTESEMAEIRAEALKELAQARSE